VQDIQQTGGHLVSSPYRRAAGVAVGKPPALEPPLTPPTEIPKEWRPF
jgi:hypothetical protein